MGDSKPTADSDEHPARTVRNTAGYRSKSAYCIDESISSSLVRPAASVSLCSTRSNDWSMICSIASNNNGHSTSSPTSELLGIPEKRRDAFTHHAGELMTLQLTPRAMTNTSELMRLIEELVDDRRRAQGDDHVSDLLRIQADTGDLTDDEVIAQCRTVVVAGTETTTAAIATALLTLLQHPTTWEALTPTTIGDVVEEILRFDGPTHLLPRESRESFQLGGQTIHAGQRLWLWLAAANRDPARFANPDSVAPSRNDSRHLAFGGGIHACIGATLARAELKDRAAWPSYTISHAAPHQH